MREFPQVLLRVNLLSTNNQEKYICPKSNAKKLKQQLSSFFRR